MLKYWPYGSAKAAIEAQTAVLASQLQGSGVTANILYPGAFVKPAPLQLSNAEIIRPTHGPVIMEAPIVWLASERSNGTNGKRITAARWKDVGWHRGGRRCHRPRRLARYRAMKRVYEKSARTPPRKGVPIRRRCAVEGECCVSNCARIGGVQR